MMAAKIRFKGLTRIGRRLVGVGCYMSPDWCLWPVAVFTPAREKMAGAFTLQFLNVGFGFYWTSR